MRKALFLLLGFLAFAPASPLYAQTVTVPQRQVVGCPIVAPGSTRTLTQDYLNGNWQQFQQDAKSVINNVTTNCKNSDGSAIVIGRQHSVLVLWLDKPPLGGDPVVYRALVQEPAGDPFNNVLPGIDAERQAFELFLSAGSNDAIATAYTSTRERNPLEAQLPAVAEAIVNPLFGLLSSTQRQLANPPAEFTARKTTATHYATVSRLVLPFARASVHVDVKVAVAPTEGGIKSDAGDLDTASRLVTGAHSDCAQTLSTRLKAILTNAAPGCGGNLSTCADTVLPAFSAEYKNVVLSCNGELDQKELLAVDAAYRAYVTGLSAAKVTGAFDLKNSPKNLVSFGVVTGYAFTGGVRNATRVKLNDDGNFVADPLDRQLNLVVVNVGFRRYNADSFNITPAERYQWFVGAVVTPDFGVATGVSARIVRGLSVNVGGALLAVNGLRSEDTLGSAPTRADDPFAIARAQVWFVGVGYNFK